LESAVKNKYSEMTVTDQDYSQEQIGSGLNSRNACSSSVQNMLVYITITIRISCPEMVFHIKGRK
jgi:hypothetical protein